MQFFISQDFCYFKEEINYNWSKKVLIQKYFFKFSSFCCFGYNFVKCEVLCFQYGFNYQVYDFYASCFGEVVFEVFFFNKLLSDNIFNGNKNILKYEENKRNIKEGNNYFISVLVGRI